MVFSKVQFRPGYREIADTNKAFAVMKMKHLFPPDASKLIPILQPGHDELVVDKDRFSAFSGNDLKEVLRSGGIKQLVMAGVATSGVILSTFTLAADGMIGKNKIDNSLRIGRRMEGFALVT